MENTRKPIFIVSHPKEFDDAVVHHIGQVLNKELEANYHVLLVPAKDSEFSFACFNHDMEDKDLANLKRYVKNIIGKPEAKKKKYHPEIAKA